MLLRMQIQHELRQRPLQQRPLPEMNREPRPPKSSPPVRSRRFPASRQSPNAPGQGSRTSSARPTSSPAGCHARTSQPARHPPADWAPSASIHAAVLQPSPRTLPGSRSVASAPELLPSGSRRSSPAFIFFATSDPSWFRSAFKLSTRVIAARRSRSIASKSSSSAAAASPRRRSFAFTSSKFARTKPRSSIAPFYRTTLPPLRLKPRPAPIPPILLPKRRLQHRRLFPRPRHLNRNHSHQQDQQPPVTHKYGKPRDKNLRKHIDRIANPRIDPRRHQRSSLCAHRKRRSQLIARHRHQHKRRHADPPLPPPAAESTAHPAHATPAPPTLRRPQSIAKDSVSSCPKLTETRARLCFFYQAVKLVLYPIRMRKFVSVTLATLLAFAPVASLQADAYHATPQARHHPGHRPVPRRPP